MEVSGQLRAPAASPPGKEPQYLLYVKLDGPQRRESNSGLSARSIFIAVTSKPGPRHAMSITLFSDAVSTAEVV